MTDSDLDASSINDDASSGSDDANADEGGAPCAANACTGDAGEWPDAGEVVGPLQLQGFGPSPGFLDLGDSSAYSYPDAINVTLSAPASSDTFVAVVPDDPSVVTVTGGGVTVPAGQTSVAVSFDALDYGSSTLTATLGVSLFAEVTVLDPTQLPTLVGLTAPVHTIAPGASLQLTVTLDIPAPSGDTTVALVATPSNGTLPSNLTIPARMTQASFLYVDNGVGLGTTISATLSSTTLDFEVTPAAGP